MWIEQTVSRIRGWYLSSDTNISLGTLSIIPATTIQNNNENIIVKARKR